MANTAMALVEQYKLDKSGLQYMGVPSLIYCSFDFLHTLSFARFY